MSPSASRYTANINLRDANDAHILAIGRVPANSRVLDLGLADGSIASTLKDMGCRVWGVEIDPVAAEAAREFCEDVAVGDLNEMDLVERFDGQQFDVVLMLDVLEHLSDPVAVLKRVAPVVDPGGWGVISLPNVAHLSVRLALLEGRFEYTEMGLLDRTHLRFFDRNGVDELLAGAGWGLFEVARVTRRFGTTEIVVGDADGDLVRQLEADPEALTYQFVVSAAPLGSAVLGEPPILPAAESQSALLEASARIRELEDQLRQPNRTIVPDLVEQLAAIRQSSMDRSGHLRHLLEAMREDTERLRRSLLR